MTTPYDHYQAESKQHSTTPRTDLEIIQLYRGGVTGVHGWARCRWEWKL